MKINILFVLLSLLALSCDYTGNTSNTEITNTETETTPTFDNKGHALVYAMTEKVGNYDKLLDKKDVVYTYTYQTPDGKTDIVTEKYKFDGELSYGAYNQHERTLPQLEGLIEQGYDGNEFWLKHEGAILTNEDFLKGVAFNRPTNFYWFTMMQKLMDEGLNYQHMGDKEIDGTIYDIVKVTFNSEEGKATDTYQLYINRETSLVDQFLFTVADYGVMETPFLMVLEYEEVDGILLPSKRKYHKSTWNADATDEPWINVTWSDIKFDNNLIQADFQK